MRNPSAICAGSVGFFRFLVCFKYSSINSYNVTGQALAIPVLMTTQTQSKLGPCVQAILSCLPERTESHDKSQFSMLTPEVVGALGKEKRKEVVIAGIETHICVLQTAMGE